MYRDIQGYAYTGIYLGLYRDINAYSAITTSVQLGRRRREEG